MTAFRIRLKQSGGGGGAQKMQIQLGRFALFTHGDTKFDRREISTKILFYYKQLEKQILQFVLLHGSVSRTRVDHVHHAVWSRHFNTTCVSKPLQT